MDELQRLRFVTERYAHLQGLRLVPLGIPFLISAAWRDGQLAWVPGTEGHGAGYWFALLMLLALGISGAVGGSYREHFGSVQPAHPWKAVLALFAFLAVFLGSVWAQQTYGWIVSLPAILIGTALGYLGVVGGQPRTHYLALSALCLVFAMLGSFGVPFHARDVLLDDLIGIGLIVIGVGDHLLLRRTLEPVSHVQTI